MLSERHGCDPGVLEPWSNNPATVDDLLSVFFLFFLLISSQPRIWHARWWRQGWQQRNNSSLVQLRTKFFGPEPEVAQSPAGVKVLRVNGGKVLQSLSDTRSGIDQRTTLSINIVRKGQEVVNKWELLPRLMCKWLINIFFVVHMQHLDLHGEENTSVRLIWETHIDMGKTCKLQAQWPHNEFKPAAGSSSSTNYCTTMAPYKTVLVYILKSSNWNLKKKKMKENGYFSQLQYHEGKLFHQSTQSTYNPSLRPSVTNR